MIPRLEIPLIEQALIDVSVSWPARCLYAYMLSRRYGHPRISIMAKDTGLSTRKISMLLGELCMKEWIQRRPLTGGRAVYDLVYKGHDYGKGF